MKAITLWQPWASLLACGAKQFETRSWATKYRGPIAIHASLKKPSDILTGVDIDVIFAMGRAFGIEEKHVGIIVDFLDSLPRGTIIATAELVNCWRIVYHPGADVDAALKIPIGGELDVPKHHPDFARFIVPSEQEMLFGDWTPGRYAWEFANMQLLPEPIPARGGQRIWNWNPDVGQDARKGDSGER